MTIADTRERMEAVLRQKVPAAVLNGDAQLANEYRDKAALIAGYLRKPRGFRFFDAMHATIDLEALARRPAEQRA